MEEQATYTSPATNNKSAINDGGAAFPNPAAGHTQYTSDGMTLRDYVSAKVLAAIIGSFPNLPAGVSPQEFSRCAVASSFVYADEWLAARAAA